MGFFVGLFIALRAKDRQCRELLAEDWFAGCLHPVLQDGGIDAAEIGVVFQIALIEVCQRWMAAKQAGGDLGTHQEHRGGGAVVGSAAGVLLHSAAKLAERHHQHPILIVLPFDVGPERIQPLRKLSHELIMARLLVGVGVEAGEAGVIDARGQTAGDHGGNGLQGVAEFTAGVVIAAMGLGHAEDVVAAELGVHGGAFKEIELRRGRNIDLFAVLAGFSQRVGEQVGRLRGGGVIKLFIRGAVVTLIAIRFGALEARAA